MMAVNHQPSPSRSPNMSKFIASISNTTRQKKFCLNISSFLYLHQRIRIVPQPVDFVSTSDCLVSHRTTCPGRRSRSQTVIKYMTDGMLLREFLSEPDLKSYSVLVRCVYACVYMQQSSQSTRKKEYRIFIVFQSPSIRRFLVRARFVVIHTSDFFLLSSLFGVLYLTLSYLLTVAVFACYA
jgi:hypothetical protein